MTRGEALPVLMSHLIRPYQHIEILGEVLTSWLYCLSPSRLRNVVIYCKCGRAWNLDCMEASEIKAILEHTASLQETGPDSNSLECAGFSACVDLYCHSSRIQKQIPAIVLPS